MSPHATVVAIYVEYDLALPPFAWRRGAAVDDDAGRSQVHRLVGMVAREGRRSARRPESRAVRLGASALLVETDLGRRDQTGRPTRVRIVVEHPADLAGRLDRCTDQVAGALADAGLAMKSARVRAALAWGLASTGPRQPDRIVFLTHQDYVRLKDDHPELLSDRRVAAGAVPARGRLGHREAAS